MIREALVEDLVEIERIYNRLFDYEEENGSKTNWVRGKYPTIENAKEKLAKGELFVGVDNGNIYGSMVLNQDQLAEYKKIKWSFVYDDDKVGVIHTLCIDPEYFGRGKGKELIFFAEEHFRNLGCLTMRFDTYEENLPATELYVRNGYRIAGVEEFFFQGFVVENLRCFEKEL
ncbi:MAG: GNAT family N-acetyltransferase [Anaerovoracaceae bacterium]